MKMNQLSSNKCNCLNGIITVPGDKSISHRSLIMGALAIGESIVTGLLEGEDVLGTAEALKALGADIYKDCSGSWHIHGVGIGGLKQPEGPLDMGNSGTGVRLMMGGSSYASHFCHIHWRRFAHLPSDETRYNTFKQIRRRIFR